MQTFFMIVCGICVTASLYLVYLAYREGEGIPWLFVAFGALFGIPLIMGLIRVSGRRSALFKRLDEKFTGKTEPKAVFVSHWFIVTAIIITVILILGAILTPLLVHR